MTGIECKSCKVLNATQVIYAAAYCASCYSAMKKLSKWHSDQINLSKITGEVPF